MDKKSAFFIILSIAILAVMLYLIGIDQVISALKNANLSLIALAIAIQIFTLFGTCAGMVLLGKKTDFDQPLIGLIDIAIKRNTYGRQKDSFEAPIEIFGQAYLGVFIRAPALESYDKTKDDIKVLSELGGEIIAIQQGHNIAVSFHPELTDDPLIHEYFIKEVLSKQNQL